MGRDVVSNIKHVYDANTALGLALALHDVAAAKDAIYYGRERVPTWPQMVRVKPRLLSGTESLPRAPQSE